MMMVLGLFVFTLSTVPYQEMQRQVAWRHPSTSRVGKRPAHQFLGLDEETITLSGILLPEITGGRISLGLLEMMGDDGRAWPLIGGNFTLFGLFTIKSLSTTRTVFFRDGSPRRIEFTLVLERIDDNSLDLLGDLTRSVLDQI